MTFYYSCFNKKISIKLYEKPNEMLDFWLKRFCPSIIKIQDSVNLKKDLEIIINKSEKTNYRIRNNKIFLYGTIRDNISYIAKFITQCFQKLLIKENILIIPASCIANKNNALLVIGDFWQGKTSSAINISSKYKYNLISDNYVAIKDGYIIGATSFISVRKEDIKDKNNSIFNVNDRYFYNNKYCYDSNLKIIGFMLPYINNGDDNIHYISKEESCWYLYQKFSRLLCGETILFDGELTSPIFLNKSNSKKILKIVDDLLINNTIKYVSAPMNIIVEEGNKILCKGDDNDE